MLRRKHILILFAYVMLLQVLFFYNFAVINSSNYDDFEQVAFIFDPTLNRDQILASLIDLDVKLVRYGAFDNIAIIEDEKSDVERIYDSGVLLMLDPIVFGGCWYEASPQSLELLSSK